MLSEDELAAQHGLALIAYLTYMVLTASQTFTVWLFFCKSLSDLAWGGGVGGGECIIIKAKVLFLSIPFFIFGKMMNP